MSALLPKADVNQWMLAPQMRQLRRFYLSINVDKVFGTHRASCDKESSRQLRLCRNLLLVEAARFNMHHCEDSVAISFIYVVTKHYRFWERWYHFHNCALLRRGVLNNVIVRRRLRDYGRNNRYGNQATDQISKTHGIISGVKFLRTRAGLPSSGADQQHTYAGHALNAG